MSPNVLGPVVGVALSIFISIAGMLVARTFDTDYAGASLLIHASASVVLLVTILVRLEAALKRRG